MCILNVLHKAVVFLLLQEYSVQITFREDWNDPRLTYDDFEGNQDLT